MVARQLRQLLRIKHLSAEGLRGADLARAAGVQPFLVDALTRQAERYTLAELQRALEAAGEADIRLRTSGLDGAMVLEKLLIQIMGNPCD